MKTAIVHDWLVSIAGGEKVLQSIYEIFPSPIYTLLTNQKILRKSFLKNAKIHTSIIQKFPFKNKFYQKYLFFFPFAIEQLDLSEYDVIISSSHCVAKGVLTRFDQLHICYCYTPMRYAWDLYFQYLKESNLKKGILGRIVQMVLHYLRMWDFSAANRVDEFVADSEFVAKRIKKLYNKKAKVIYPPVDINYYEPKYQKEDFYLTASRFVPYKKIDLIVEAFSEMENKKLIVIGDGPDMKKIKSKAKKNIKILGYQNDEVLRFYLQKARAFVFAAIEDFGILPVEAQACATPVICFSKGGTKETIINNKTGILFDKQDIKSIQEAIEKFERQEFDLYEVRKNALRFSEERFKKEFKRCVLENLEKHSWN